jgi:hypothetical protein
MGGAGAGHREGGPLGVRRRGAGRELGEVVSPGAERDPS